MGYDIHITRRENWFDDDEQKEIKLSEWIDYIKSDNEMRLDNQAQAAAADEDIVLYENSGVAVWTSYSKHGHAGTYAWFDFRNGNVIVKNADQEIINKMIDIASRLKAKVQGDDGETYHTKLLFADKPPWWKFWR